MRKFYTLVATMALMVSSTAALATTDTDPGITAPTENAVLTLTDTLGLAAADADAQDGAVNWAVRYDTCDAVASANWAGNVTGVDDDYTWQDGQFAASVDTSTWPAGEYCFVFNPTAGERDTVRFSLDTAVVTVTEANLGVDWHVNIADGGAVAFVDDATAPYGGALQLITGETNQSRAQLNSDQDDGMALADVNNVGLHTFVSEDSTGSDLHAPAINLAITNTGTDGTGGFTTLVFEPIYTHGNDAIVPGSWQNWDGAGEAQWWSTNAIEGVCSQSCFVQFDDIKAANPDAVVLGYAVNLGTWNPNIEARTDGFTVGAKTFDFEPAPPPRTADDCKQGGWETMTDTDGAEFRNQGDCVSYFASEGRTRGQGGGKS